MLHELTLMSLHPHLPQAVLDPNAVVPVAVAHGDGIGPEIMESTLRVLEAAQARIDPIPVKMGLEVYESGISTGISEDAWETIHRTKLLLKAPITTPRGGGVKSLNVTMRKTLGLFCNLRPCFAMAPFVPTHFPKANLVIVRENEEVRDDFMYSPLLATPSSPFVDIGVGSTLFIP